MFPAFHICHVWSVVVAALSGFVLGGFWYSSLLFGKSWCQETGVIPEERPKGHPAKVFIIAFFLSLLAAFLFDYWLGPSPSLHYAVGMGIMIGIGWVATSMGINYLFAGKSFKLFLIDAGYHAVKFSIYGVIFGLWR